MKGGKRVGAGRPSGSLNKRSKALAERLETKFPNWCPIEQMAKIAQNSRIDINTRIHCAEKVASYIYGKPKTMDLNLVATGLTLDPVIEANRVRQALAKARAFEREMEGKPDRFKLQ